MTPRYIAIDGEFDQADKRNVLCKLSLVDDEGRILLDTLVNPGVPIDYSCVKIHGVRSEWLADAPSVEDVRNLLKQRFSEAIFVGHGVTTDLKVLALDCELSYVDTAWIEDRDKSEFEMLIPAGNPRKLKDLCRMYLNASIQEGEHSSVSLLRA